MLHTKSGARAQTKHTMTPTEQAVTQTEQTVTQTEQTMTQTEQTMTQTEQTMTQTEQTMTKTANNDTNRANSDTNRANSDTNGHCGDQRLKLISNHNILAQYRPHQRRSYRKRFITISPPLSLSLSTIKHCRTTVSDPNSCYGSRQTLTFSWDSVLCLWKIAHGGFLSAITHCPMVMSESVCRTTWPDNGFGPELCSRERAATPSVV